MSLSIAFCISLFLSITLIPVLIRNAPKLGLIDIPDGMRKIHTVSIPRCGGIAIALSALVPSIYFANQLKEQLFFIAGSVTIVVFGLLDDRFNLHYRWKFFGQILAAILALLSIPDLSQLPFFWDPEKWPLLSYSVVFIFLVAATNAVNLADGLDGLAGGATLLSLALIAYLAWTLNIHHVALVSIAVIGSLLGFLRYNTHPAKVFMGDTGSQFIGYTTAVLSILLTQHPLSPLSPLLPLLLVGLPMIDTLMVMVIRIHQKRSPFSADKSHIHHQLISFGLKHYEAVAFIYLLQIVYITLAFTFRYASDHIVLSVYVLTSSTVLSGFYLLNKLDWLRPPAANTIIDKLPNYLTRLRFFHSGPYAVLGILIAICIYASAFFDQVIPGHTYAKPLVIVTLLFYLIFSKSNNLIHIRITFYIICAVSAYIGLVHPFTSEQSELLKYLNLSLILVLFFAVTFNPHKSFQLDNQDILVLALLVGASILPIITNIQFLASEMMVRLVVMLYAAEFVITCLSHRTYLLRFMGGLILILYAILH